MPQKDEPIIQLPRFFLSEGGNPTAATPRVEILKQ